ncbi:MAG: hypothetical protein OXO48_10930 [Caldilineaceae bacterium]|nr:hypothetical protein [Caldilineaceae bacterium]
MPDELAEAMATVHQKFRDLDQKLDERFEIVDQDIKNLETKIDDRIENLETKMDQRFDNLLAEVRLINTRLQLMGSLFDHQESRLSKVEERVSRLEKQPA